MVNVAKVIKAQKDKYLKQIIEEADLCGADGVPLVWVSKLTKEPISGRVNGTDLMEKFFGISKEQKIIRYEKGSLSFEVFITEDKSQTSDIFTHSCLLIENRDEFVDKAISMGFEVIKVSRQDSNGYYLFIKDLFHNLYEIKEKA